MHGLAKVQMMMNITHHASVVMLNSELSFANVAPVDASGGDEWGMSIGHFLTQEVDRSCTRNLSMAVVPVPLSRICLKLPSQLLPCPF